jgi:endonuclease YncB( thermonuclease family)
MKTIATASVAWLVCSLAQAADLSGVPRVMDGDTLTIGATKVRLEGIDARDELAARIAGRDINCSSQGVDVYKRTLAICSIAGEDLNAWMVKQGWTLAYVQFATSRSRDHLRQKSLNRVGANSV